MQTSGSRAPKQLICNVPPHVALTLETLEGAGFRIVGNPQEFGAYIGVDFFPPEDLRGVMSSDNTHYQQIIDHQCALARRALRRVGLDAEVRPFGWMLSIWLPLSKKRNRVGRPREDRELVQQVRSLRDAGCTWPEIAKHIQKLTSTRRTPDSYRKLLNRI
jgi:hypothetical protein